MSSQILASIPGIHATIIGILLAFLSGYFIYSFQKIIDTKLKLLKSIEFSKKICTPNYFIFNDFYPDLTKSNGRIDLIKDFDPLLHKASTFYSHLYSNSKILEQYKDSMVVDTAEATLIVEKITPYFQIILTTYPLNGESNDLNLLKMNINHDFSSFTYERLNEIKVTVNLITSTWKIYNQSLQHLFKSVDNYKNYNSPQHSNYTDVMISFFTKFEFYQNNVLPIIDEATSDFHMYNNLFKLRKITILSLIFTIYILIVGVVTPILIIDTSNISKSVIYGIFLLSFLPYFLILLIFLIKIIKADFK